MKNKKRVMAVYHAAFVLILCCYVMVSAGCGAGGSGGGDGNRNSAVDEFGVSSPKSLTGDQENSGDAADISNSEDTDAGHSESGNSESGKADGDGDQEESPKAAEKKEMLVYRSQIQIDTLEFDKTCAAFDRMMEEYEGFIESKNVSDNGDSYDYYIREEDREDRQYTMMVTVRIPAEHYRSFMSRTSELGDVRSSEENVTNMTQTYGTLKAQLDIYETEYKSYLKMLAKAKNDSTMLAIREKISEISVQIATIKNEMEGIHNDVSYSTVNLTIREVSEYEEVEDKTTFGNRLMNTLRQSWEELLGFLESVLFFILLHWYKFVFFALFVFLIIRVCILLDKRSRKKMQKMRQQTGTGTAVPPAGPGEGMNQNAGDGQSGQEDKEKTQ